MRTVNKKRLATLERKATPAPAAARPLGFAPVAQNNEDHPDLYSYQGELYTDQQLSALPVKRLIIITKAYGPLDQGELDDDEE